MITLKFNNSGEVKKFNLKSFDREKALRDACKAMVGDPKYASKKIKLTTNEYGQFTVPVKDIKECIFDESIFCVGEVKIG